MVRKITDPLQEKIYNLAVASQEVALNVIRPGVTAESIHKEYASFIEENGYDYPLDVEEPLVLVFLKNLS